MPYLFEPAVTPSVAIAGSDSRFPVRRVYCVGRNYAEHAREMGFSDREPPFFFAKPADAVTPDGADVPYPPRTGNLHHEIEPVLAIGKGGANIPVEQALDHIFGYAVGNDLTRRDLQAQAREAGKPWDTAKGFDASAPVSAIHPASVIGHPSKGAIWLKVNGADRQSGDIADLIWSVPEIVAELSTLFTLAPGDLIFTGTPAGVGALTPGDLVEGGVDGVDTLRHRVV